MHIFFKRYLLNHIAGVACIAGLFGIMGCSGVPFELMDDGYAIKPGKSIAVVAGVNDEASTRLAQIITRELAAKSVLRVVSQEEILKRIPSYPATIIDAAWVVSETEEAESARSKQKHRVNVLQDRLKTDYVLVVWSEGVGKMVLRNQQGGCFDYTGYRVEVRGRLLEYPKSKLVGYSNYNEHKTKSCCLMFRSEGEDIDILTVNSAEEIAGKLMKLTQTEKK